MYLLAALQGVCGELAPQRLTVLQGAQTYGLPPIPQQSATQLNKHNLHAIWRRRGTLKRLLESPVRAIVKVHSPATVITFKSTYACTSSGAALARLSRRTCLRLRSPGRQDCGDNPVPYIASHRNLGKVSSTDYLAISVTVRHGCALVIQSRATDSEVERAWPAGRKLRSLHDLN